MLQMASEKGFSGQVPADVDLDYKDLANPTSQATKTAEIIDATDAARVDIDYGSFASSSEVMPEESSDDPIKDFVVQASVTKEERAAAYIENINNEYDINSERASDGVKNARSLMAMKLDSERGNMVLQKLLRAPRYFDYPESNWLACYDFNEDGDKSNKDKAKQGRNSCYICGDLDHLGNHCKKVNAYNICSVMAVNCPRKNAEPARASTPCLKCGNTGHDMFSCSNDYDPDDLKDMECYICKKTGHLCCAAGNRDEGPTEPSCYLCGQSGHSGLECTHSNVVAFDPRLLCRICKERGHSRKQCPKNAKAKLKRRKYWIARRMKLQAWLQSARWEFSKRPVGWMQHINICCCYSESSDRFPSGRNSTLP